MKVIHTPCQTLLRNIRKKSYIFNSDLFIEFRNKFIIKKYMQMIPLHKFYYYFHFLRTYFLKKKETQGLILK